MNAPWYHSNLGGSRATFLKRFFFFDQRFVNEIQSRLVRLGVQIFGGKKRLNFSFQEKKESSHVRAQRKKERKKERERGREVIVCKDNNKARDENDALFFFFFFFFVGYDREKRRYNFHSYFAEIESNWYQILVRGEYGDEKVD